MTDLALVVHVVIAVIVFIVSFAMGFVLAASRRGGGVSGTIIPRSNNKDPLARGPIGVAFCNPEGGFDWWHRPTDGCEWRYAHLMRSEMPGESLDSNEGER